MNAIERLQMRAFGGEDVAARPDAPDDDWWPKGPLLPGVIELIGDLAQRPFTSDGLNIYFLLGGAGNGKSFAARALAMRLGIDLGSGEKLARRKYERSVDGADVVILNDATIANSAEYKEMQSVALAADIAEWTHRSATRPVIAFCCVNRGIIVDELRALETVQGCSSEVAQRLLRWIAGVSETVADGAEAPPEDFRQPLLLGSHYRESSSTIAGTKVRAFALSVDSTSIVTQVKQGQKSAARGLMAAVVALCLPEALKRDPNCPILANLTNLQAAAAVDGWAGILDGAEVASGRYFSYRDLWALIALTIVGPKVAESTNGAQGAVGAVDALLHRLSLASNTAERLEALLGLSQHRLSCALYRAPVPREDGLRVEYPPGTPFHGGLILVDPAVWGGKDTEAIEPAMAEVALGGRPSAVLRTQGHPLSTLWTPFDEALEQVILEAVNSPGCMDGHRRGLISWYGAYLIRLTSLATGNIGNKAAIRVLEDCRIACKVGPALPPSAVDSGLRKLLLPDHGLAGDHKVMMRAFAARAEPLDGGADEALPTLAEVTHVGSLSMRLRQRNGRVVLECHIAGQENTVGELTLDLPLVREALAWSEGKSGQTDASIFIEPRLERCRASSLSAMPDTFKRLVFATTSGQVELSQ
jgi:hypothetical protein